MTILALVFDVDGTLAETEECHRTCFNQAFAEHGLEWTWDRSLYTRLLAVTGGRERIVHYARSRGQDIDAASLHARKTELYNERVRKGAVTLRPGVMNLIDRARREGLLLAIGTTTSRRSVTALLETTLGPEAGRIFASIRTGEDVRRKKPDPEVYRLVLSDLALDGRCCLCIEDSRNGLVAARAAGMHTVVTPSLYTCHEDFSDADLVIGDLSMPWSAPEFRPLTS